MNSKGLINFFPHLNFLWDFLVLMGKNFVTFIEDWFFDDFTKITLKRNTFDKFCSDFFFWKFYITTWKTRFNEKHWWDISIRNFRSIFNHNKMWNSKFWIIIHRIIVILIHISPLLFVLQAHFQFILNKISIHSQKALIVH